MFHPSDPPFTGATCRGRYGIVSGAGKTTGSHEILTSTGDYMHNTTTGRMRRFGLITATAAGFAGAALAMSGAANAEEISRRPAAAGITAGRKSSAARSNRSAGHLDLQAARDPTILRRKLVASSSRQSNCIPMISATRAGRAAPSTSTASTCTPANSSSPARSSTAPSTRSPTTARSPSGRRRPAASPSPPAHRANERAARVALARIAALDQPRDHGRGWPIPDEAVGHVA